MPFDNFFKSGYRRKEQRSAIVAARHRRSWPAGTQYEAQTKLEMRGGERPEWWHFLSVPQSQAGHELSEWREANPGFEFRIVT